MTRRWVSLAVAGLVTALPLGVQAQHFPPPMDEPEQSVQPAQPQAAPTPSKPAKKKKAEKKTPPPAPLEQAPVVNLPVEPDGQPPPADAPSAAAPATHAKAAAPAHAVTCAGTFAKNSSHLKLAQVFGVQNLTFTEVDGPQNSKLPASVLYPKDPKRHLEVLWNNEAARSDTLLIVITGQSTWTGPKGLHLGMPIAALEKLNGKAFQVAGFDQDNPGAALDWQGGALDKVPGGCKIGIKMTPDPKASDEAKSAAGGKVLMSSDAVVRAVKPTVAEILIGY